MALRDGLLPVSIGLGAILAVILAYGGARLGYAHFRRQWWPQFPPYRYRILEQLAPWLRPARAIPLLAPLGGLLALCQWALGPVTVVLLGSLLGLALFGRLGLVGMIGAGVPLSGLATSWKLPAVEWTALIVTGALGLGWLGDWFARRRPAGEGPAIANLFRLGTGMLLTLLLVLGNELLRDWAVG